MSESDVNELRLAYLSMRQQAELAAIARRRSDAERRLLDENGRLVSLLAALRRYLRRESQSGRLQLPSDVTAAINVPLNNGGGR